MTQTYSDPDYANRMLQGEKCVKRIEQGLDAEHYVKWAKEGTWAVKMALLERGHAFDVLIHDDTQQIRRMVMEADRSYMKYRTHSEYDIVIMNNILDDMIDIEPEVIKAQIAYYEKNESCQHPLLTCQTCSFVPRTDTNRTDDETGRTVFIGQSLMG